MDAFGGKNTFVIGAGRSGFASALLLLREGARVSLFDERPKEDVERSLGHPVPPQIAFVHGRMPEKAALGADLVVLSPGVPREKIPLQTLARAGTPVWGELELGFRRFSGKVAAVTGTNGKSSTPKPTELEPNANTVMQPAINQNGLSPQRLSNDDIPASRVPVARRTANNPPMMKTKKMISCAPLKPLGIAVKLANGDTAGTSGVR